LQEITESGVPKDVNMLCRIFPEGIADKAFPADSSTPLAVFYATVRLACPLAMVFAGCEVNPELWTGFLYN